MGKPIVVTDSTFEREMLDAEAPVLVDFWAAWCAPCKAIAPVLEQLAEEYAGDLKIAKIDVDENPATAMQFGVRSIPTLVVFKDGEQVERFSGAVLKKTLVTRIRPHLTCAAVC